MSNNVKTAALRPQVYLLKTEIQQGNQKGNNT